MDKFKFYALYYDLLYADKDYRGEVNYILQLINDYAKVDSRLILDLGCGTGIHANLLSKKGYVVDGVDLSENMIDIAKNNNKGNSKLSFYLGDVTSYRSDKKYDVVTSLFHVISYQNTNRDLLNTVETISRNLSPDGICIFDFWYGPGVLSNLPEKRIKKLENDLISVKRTANPMMHFNDNVVDVNYQIDVFDKKNRETKKIEEVHSMRYLFKPEIDLCLKQFGFESVGFFDWMSKDIPCEKTWSAVVIAKKVNI